MINQKTQTTLLEEHAESHIHAWQAISFETLLDSFHGNPVPGKYGRMRCERFHTFYLDQTEAEALINNESGADIERLRVYLALDAIPALKPASTPSISNKFTLLVQGRKHGDNAKVNYDKCYKAINCSSEFNHGNGNNSLTMGSQATTIPYSLARLYVDEWNKCNATDIVGSFHAPITYKDKNITVSERVVHYTYSHEDIAGLKKILEDNKEHLYLNKLYFFLGAGDPNPEFGHPFAFRPVMRAVFNLKDTSKKINEIGVTVPSHVKFTQFEEGDGGVVTLEFATPCPPVCNGEG